MAAMDAVDLPTGVDCFFPSNANRFPLLTTLSFASIVESDVRRQSILGIAMLALVASGTDT
jgi:hypothetical protein